MGAHARVVGLWWSVWLLSASPCVAQVVLNEVVPDPLGRDAGHEFVELYNAGSANASLAGAVVEVWHGARRGWVRAWEGSARDVCVARGFFILGDPAIGVTPDGPLDSDLTNASGAVRLRDARRVWSVVGWGALDDSTLFEAAPAAAPGTGEALARVPDGRNTGSTAHDWLALATPTPRCSNGTRGARFAATPVNSVPLLPWPGRAARLVFRLGVVGPDDIRTEGSTFVVEVRGPRGGDPVRLPATLPSVLAAQETTDVACAWTPEIAGVWGVHGVMRNASGDSLACDASVRVGAGAWCVDEIMASPHAGEPEWIEVLNTSPEFQRLESLTLLGPHGERVALPARAVAPRARVVVCGSCAALATAFPELEPSTCVEVGATFPRLPLRVGDAAAACALLESSGAVADWAPFGLVHGASGRALERFDRGRSPDDPLAWQWSVDARGGTPGIVNSAAPSAITRPPHLRVEAAGVPAAVIDLGDVACDAVLSLCALSGRRVADLARYSHVRGLLRVPLTRDTVHAEPGMYALVLDVRAGDARGVTRRAVTWTVTP